MSRQRHKWSQGEGEALFTLHKRADVDTNNSQGYSSDTAQLDTSESVITVNLTLPRTR
jgi:hypothetical protein